jgi:hypothetical protein
VVNITEEGKTAKAFGDELKARDQDTMDEARAEMILLVEDGQLSHMRSPDVITWLGSSPQACTPIQCSDPATDRAMVHHSSRYDPPRISH